VRRPCDPTDQSGSRSFKNLRGRLSTGLFFRHRRHRWASRSPCGRSAGNGPRKGKDVKLKARQIKVHSIRLTAFEYPNFQLEIECGTGTYVRSLGRDIGARVGSAAIMTALQRTSIGPFLIHEAIDVSELDAQNISQNLLPVDHCLQDLERVVLNDAHARGLIDAQPVHLPAYADSDRVVAVDKHDRVLAVLHRRDSNIFTPKINFSKYWNS